MRYLSLPLLLLAACHAMPAARRNQVQTCEIVSHSGEDVTRCLVMKFDWDGRDALGPGQSWQAHLDSIARVLADLAAQQAARESLALEDAVDAWARGSRASLLRAGVLPVAADTILKMVRMTAGHPPDTAYIRRATRHLTDWLRSPYPIDPVLRR